MPDQDAPLYRYWGAHKPARMGVVAEKSGKTATMKIYDPIDDWGAPFGVSAKEFGQALEELDGDVDTIELHVHSPGGVAWEGVAIMNLLRQHPAKVHAVVDGMAASAASYIVVGGADRVTMAPNATLMIHDASGMCYGQAADMQVMLDRLEMLSQNIAEVYATKAGGSAADWRSAMQPETWYTADEAVKAGLADDKLAKPPASDAPTDRFDLSIFAHAGRDHAPAPFMPAARAATQTPAEPPEKHPHPKEAVAMTDTELKALRERLGLAENADIAAVNAKLDELEEQATKPPAEVTDEQALAVLAKAQGVDVEKIKAAVTAAKGDAPVVPAGMKLVDEAQWTDVVEQAKLGATARADQLARERDAVIEQAVTDGKLSRNADNIAKLKADWDADVKTHGNADATRQRISDMAVLFPVGQARGYAGSDTTDGDGTKPFTDDEAAALAQLSGTSKEALING